MNHHRKFLFIIQITAILVSSSLMSKKIINSPKAPAPIGPYSQAIIAGNTLYISGQIALDAATGMLITDDIVRETNQVMHNLKHILAEAGAGFSNEVKCTNYVKDLNNFGKIN